MKDFVKFCKKYGQKNLRSHGAEIHYSVPITEDTTAFLEKFFKWSKTENIYSFGQYVGIRYKKKNCIWEEYITEYDCSYSTVSGIKDMLIAYLPKMEVACEAY